VRPPITSSNDPATIPAVTTGQLKVWMDAGDTRNVSAFYSQRGSTHYATDSTVSRVANRALPDDLAWNPLTVGVAVPTSWQYREKDATFSGPGITGYIESNDAFGTASGVISVGRLAIDPTWMPNPNLGSTLYFLFRRNDVTGNNTISEVLKPFLDVFTNSTVRGVAGSNANLNALLPGGTVASGWANTVHLFRIQIDGGVGSLSRFYRETGGSVITGVTTAALLATYPATDAVYIGRNAQADGACPMAFCEFIAYEHTRGPGEANRFSRADDLAIRSYLNTKWGLGYTIAADTSLPE
jgi:hypothetical protein